MIRRIFLIFFFLILFFPSSSRAAIFKINPAGGNFSVGSTFDLSILLDTEGQSINAVSLSLYFPPDTLQVVSPSTGKSVIGVWTSTPKFDNKNGKIELQGGIPDGIIASNALVSTITFRVKSVGDGLIKFSDESKVLLNDGLGTNVLNQTVNALYKFKLPPPNGPIVSSTTHPDQSVWYQHKTVSLQYFNNKGNIEGYSYLLSEDPTTIPDNIIEGKNNYISYNNLADGTHYFHIKALRNGVWGGVTHFSIKIDSTAPADFKLGIIPSKRTYNKQPVFQFSTTDALSGVDYYELKLIPLSPDIADSQDINQLFVEATSPYISSSLELGNYDVIVRAYDKSGNYNEVVERLTITTPIFSFISGEGIRISRFTISWTVIFFILFLLFFFLFDVSKKIWVWRHNIHLRSLNKELPPDVSKQLEELKKYRDKYGPQVLMFLFMISSLWMGLSNEVFAQTREIAPPLISTFSKNISNEEIFYVGGKTDFINENVVIYVQNLSTGETFSHGIISDQKGDWFYRHNSFLSPGSYLLWAQGKIGEELSPPGPQVKMMVNRTAVQFGGGRLSYEAIYLFIIIILLLGIIGLTSYIIFHYYHGRRKHREFESSVKEAEESIKRGFAVLKRDIEAELAIVRQAKLNSTLSLEEKTREAQLLSDLESIQSRLGQEIWEIERQW